MRFQFTAATESLDHEISRRLNEQARSHVAPDMDVWSVTVLTPWKFNGSTWSAEVEALVDDGRDPFNPPTGSDRARIARDE